VFELNKSRKFPLRALLFIDVDKFVVTQPTKNFSAVNYNVNRLTLMIYSNYISDLFDVFEKVVIFNLYIFNMYTLACWLLEGYLYALTVQSLQ
jgi:hypothetical protein